jgi:predicted ATPase
LLYAGADAGTPNIHIEVENDDTESIVLNMEASSTNNVAKASNTGDLDKAKQTWPLFREDFVYLYADRKHPQSKYIKEKPTRLDSRLGDKTANDAAFRLAQAVNTNEQLAINELKHVNASDLTIARNVNAWINYVMGSSVGVTAEETEKDKEAKFVYSVRNKQGEELQLSPLNMPFGNSYVLPIVLAVLTAPEGSMILIENPESHLHPSAQIRLGELLSRAAKAGIQIVVETHSDHLMNGIRMACHQGLIGNDDIEMDLIGIEKDGVTHSRQNVSLDSDGYVENWIPGFFDEWETALKTLIP